MKIVQAPHEVLAQKAQPVIKVDKTIKKLLKDMEKTLLSATNPEGVGLAAPQVGKSLQIFIVRHEPDAPIMTFINPVIESFHEAQRAPTDEKKGVQLEGCLSLKNVWGVVTRHTSVTISYQDGHGRHHKKTFGGFLATIIQHETDHLNGALFPKRVLEQKNPLYHSSKNSKGEIEFEEIKI